MLKLRASSILDATKLRVRVLSRVAWEAVGWVIVYYALLYFNPSSEKEKLLWCMAVYVALKLAYRIEMIKAKSDLR